MAILLDTSNSDRHVLKPYYVLGRSATHADCVLASPLASLIHASIRWHAEQWTLTDQSRNGTFLNGERLPKDQATPMHAGDDICFGSLESTPWRLIDASAPADLLMPLSLGQHTIKLAPFQNLPDDTTPLACIYRTADGQWMKETHDGVTPLNHGDLVYIGATAWRLVCAEERPGTLIPSSAITCMRFQHDQDDAHVSLHLRRGRAEMDLGEQPHHELLILLARQRLRDAERGLDDPHAQGWIDFERLACMLDMDQSHLNIQLFRLRKQFEQAVEEGLICHGFMERRQGGVRLGQVGIEIWQGAELEGSWEPDHAHHV